MKLERTKEGAPMFVIMTGIPGSGKSTIAESLEIENVKDLIVFSSDRLREGLYGDASIQGDNKELFALLHDRIREHVNAGKDAVYDATNITLWQRKSALELAGDAETVSVFVNTPLPVCLARNAERPRKVPEAVIRRMDEQLVPPLKREGFDQTIIVCMHNISIDTDRSRSDDRIRVMTGIDRSKSVRNRRDRNEDLER